MAFTYKGMILMKNLQDAMPSGCLCYFRLKDERNAAMLQKLRETEKLLTCNLTDASAQQATI